MSALPKNRPLLVTERLELWVPRPDDLESMFAIVSRPETGRFLGPQSTLHEHSIRFMRNAGSWFLYGYGAMQLRLRGEPALIGACGVFHTFRGLGDDFDDHPEVGWIVASDHVGQGLATEAMQAVLGWFDREHGPRRIVCMIAPENGASFRIAARLGFTAYRDAELPHGETVTLLERGAE